MLRRVLASTVALALVTGPTALAYAADNGHTSAAAISNGGPAIAIMSRLDENDDGTVTLDEFGGERIEVLRNADADGDGKLSRQELANYLIDRDYQRRAERAAKRLDIDGDGAVAIAEIEDYQGKRFALIDRNNDGELSENELRQGAFALGARSRDREGLRRHHVRRTEGPHKEFKHRTAPASKAAPDKTPDEN